MSFFFQISGVAIITVGALIQATYYNYSDFVDSSYVSAPIVLIIVGVIVFIVAFFGCCGASRENHCMIITVRSYPTSSLISSLMLLLVRSVFAGYFHVGTCCGHCWLRPLW